MNAERFHGTSDGESRGPDFLDKFDIKFFSKVEDDLKRMDPDIEQDTSTGLAMAIESLSKLDIDRLHQRIQDPVYAVFLKDQISVIEKFIQRHKLAELPEWLSDLEEKIPIIKILLEQVDDKTEQFGREETTRIEDMMHKSLIKALEDRKKEKEKDSDKQ